jgi:CubicO group peptidase (beta-lactamase class C family)
VVDPVDVRIARALSDLRPEGVPPAGVSTPRRLSDRLRDCATPGAGIAVIDGFNRLWSGGFGARARDGVIPVTARTRFQAASISKPVFALAVMRLAQDGVLDLDADVNRYLTTWRIPAIEGWQPHVTLRGLLSHTAGTAVDGFAGYPVVGPLPTPVQTLEGVPPANNPPVIVDRLPGLQARYSGGGTTIAQLAVTDRLRRPFAALMHELVLAPLGMADSSFEQPPPPAIVADAAVGHPWNGVAIPGGWHVYPEQAAAGLWTTAADLARLGAAVMTTLVGRPSALGLTRASIAAMLQPQLPRISPAEDNPGLGFFCRGDGKGLRFFHNGSNAGFASVLCCVPATGQGAVVMLNANQGAPVRAEIVAAIAREYDWPAQDVPAGEKAPADAARRIGRYRNAQGLELGVESAGDGLLLQIAGQPPVPLEALSGAHYRARVVALGVRFAPDGLTLIDDGRSIEFVRVTSSERARS